MARGRSLAVFVGIDHGPAEDLPEDLRERPAELVEVDVAADLFREGCYPLALKAARNDQVEVGKVGVGIEREPVGRDPLLDADADCAELRVADPRAGHPRLPRRNHAVSRGRADHHFLELLEVPLDVTLEGAEIHDRIADDLSRAVIGHVAAAIRLDDLDVRPPREERSEEHTSELQSRFGISYAVFRLKKK